MRLRSTPADWCLNNRRPFGMQKNPACHNILIVRTDRIGDVVLTTPVIAALHARWPQARLTMLVTPLTRELVAGHPYLHEVLLDDRRGRHRGAAGFGRLVREIRKRNFDTAIVYHTKRRTNALCFLSGIPRRIGYRNDKWGFLLTRQIPDQRHRGLKHEARYCLDVLKVLGIEDGVEDIRISIQPEAEQWAARLLEKAGPGQKKVVVVHPDASCPTKKWPDHRFIELMQRMRQEFSCFFIIIGTPANKATAAGLMDAVKGDILDLTGKTSVAQLVSLLRRSHLLVSNDSGPVHVAAGVGTPVVSIFTRNQPGINPERWKPLGEKSRVVAPPVDEHISFAKGRVRDPRYLEIIQVHEVFEAVDALFKLCYNQRS